MTQKVPGSETLSGDGVVHPEGRYVVPDAVFPLEETLIDKDAYGCRSERLGRRADRKERGSRDRKLGCDVPATEALSKNDLSVSDYSNRTTRDFPDLELFFDEPFEITHPQLHHRLT